MGGSFAALCHFQTVTVCAPMVESLHWTNHCEPIILKSFMLRQCCQCTAHFFRHWVNILYRTFRVSISVDTTSPTTTPTTTGTTSEGLNPMVILALGLGIGGVLVVAIVLVFLRRRTWVQREPTRQQSTESSVLKQGKASGVHRKTQIHTLTEVMGIWLLNLRTQEWRRVELLITGIQSLTKITNQGP